jgi:hypothetical protein
MSASCGVLKEALKTHHSQASNELSRRREPDLILSLGVSIGSSLPEMSRQGGEESRAANDPRTRVCVAMRTRHLHLVTV